MKLNLLVGNIGTGKSTIARKLANKGNIVVCRDDIQLITNAGLYGKYPKNVSSIYHKTEEVLIRESLKNGFDVCVDRTNIDKKTRARFINIAKGYNANIVCYDFGEGNIQYLERRIKQSRGVSEETWTNVYQNIKMKYEKPEIEEGFSEIITPPKYLSTYAFDFDGVIVQNKFPGIGEVNQEAVDKIRELYESLRHIVIIWTCRSGKYLNNMQEFLIKNEIPFDYINENPLFETGSRKIFANFYYDDRNEAI